VLTYRASRRAVVTFLVEGPGPSCARRGALRVRSRAGVNRLRFRGRLGNRVLAPGTYRIRQRFSAGGVLVTVLPRRGGGGFNPRAPQCGPTFAVTAPDTTATPLFSDLSAAVSSVPGAAVATSAPAGNSASPSPSGAKDRSRPERVAGVVKDVLGAISPRRLSPIDAGTDDEVSTAIAIAALGLLLLAAFAIVLGVIDFIRRTTKEA
jgi:hypothetical protein